MLIGAKTGLEMPLLGKPCPWCRLGVMELVVGQHWDSPAKFLVVSSPSGGCPSPQSHPRVGDPGSAPAPLLHAAPLGYILLANTFVRVIFSVRFGGNRGKSLGVKQLLEGIEAALIKGAQKSQNSLFLSTSWETGPFWRGCSAHITKR